MRFRLLQIVVIGIAMLAIGAQPAVRPDKLKTLPQRAAFWLAMEQSQKLEK